MEEDAWYWDQRFSPWTLEFSFQAQLKGQKEKYRRVSLIVAFQNLPIIVVDEKMVVVSIASKEIKVYTIIMIVLEVISNLLPKESP